MIEIVFASYFTTNSDPIEISKYRKHVIRDDTNNKFWVADYKLLLPLINSVVANNCKIVIFHDCFDNPPNLNNCTWIKVNYNKKYVPTVYRWFVYKNYIDDFKKKNIFMVDSTDVIMLKNSVLFDDKIYCGSEYKSKFSNIVFLNKKIKYINIKDFKYVYNKYRNHILLNAGVVGGKYDLCCFLLDKLTTYHEQTSQNVQMSLDMPIFNYVLFKYFNNDIIYGDEITTKFLDYESNNNISLWKHK